MFGLLVLLFTIVPAVEIYLMIKVGGHIGGFNTFLIVIVTGILGASLAKTQGLQVIHKIQEQLANKQIPTDQIIHAFLVFAGGLLLLTPGFLTDILGFSMVIPFIRLLYVSRVKKLFKNGIKNGNIVFTSFHFSNQNDERQSRHETLDSDTFEADYEKKE